MSTTAPVALAVAVLLSPITSTSGESTTEIARPVSHDTDSAQSVDYERYRATPSPSPSASRSAEPAGSPAPIRRAAPSPSPTPVAVRQQAARVTTSPAAAPPQSGATTADTTTQNRPGARSAPDLATGIAARSGSVSASTRGGEERPPQQPPTTPGAVDLAQQAAPVPADAGSRSLDPERRPTTGPDERGVVEASALVHTVSRQRTIALLPWLLAALVVGVAVALADRRRRT